MKPLLKPPRNSICTFLKLREALYPVLWLGDAVARYEEGQIDLFLVSMMIDGEPVPGPSKSTGLTISGPKSVAVGCNAGPVAQRFGSFGLSRS